jgi:hypothetical protein
VLTFRQSNVLLEILDLFSVLWSREFLQLKGGRGASRPRSETASGATADDWNWELWRSDVRDHAPLLSRTLLLLAGTKCHADEDEDHERQEEEEEADDDDVDPILLEEADDEDGLGELPGAPPLSGVARRERVADYIASQLLFGRNRLASGMQRVVGHYCYAKNLPQDAYGVLNAAGLSLSYSAIARIVSQRSKVAKSQPDDARPLARTLLGYDNGQRNLSVNVENAGATNSRMLNFAASLRITLPDPTPAQVAAGGARSEAPVTVQDIMARNDDVKLLRDCMGRIVTMELVQMGFTATAGAAAKRGVALVDPTGLVELARGRVFVPGRTPAGVSVADDRPKLRFPLDGLQVLGQYALPSLVLFTSRVAFCSLAQLHPLIGRLRPPCTSPACHGVLKWSIFLCFLRTWALPTDTPTFSPPASRSISCQRSTPLARLS